MRTELYWIASDGPGRLAIMPRPRGGDWLEDEIQSWRRAGVDVVVSLLTDREIADLGLSDESQLCLANDILHLSFPIHDRTVPSDREAFSELVAGLGERLNGGENIAIHCRQGIGRAALLAICVLVWSGREAEEAIRLVVEARGCSVPETPEQRRYIDDFARSRLTAIR